MQSIYFHRLYSSGNRRGNSIIIGTFVFLLLLVLMLVIVTILGFKMSEELFMYGFYLVGFCTLYLMGKISPHNNVLEASINQKRFKLVLRDISDESMFIKKVIIDTENQDFTLDKDFLGKKYLVKGNIKVPYSYVWMRNIGKFIIGDDRKIRNRNIYIENDFDFIPKNNRHFEIGLHEGQMRVFIVEHTDEVLQNLQSYTPESAKTMLSWEDTYKLISSNDQ